MTCPMSTEMVAAAGKNIFPWVEGRLAVIKANNFGMEVPDEARLLAFVAYLIASQF